ncbi:hypothetical protein MSPP1_000979 [Malassezia sp. CBS 17886]|nr:hypothetical protein MSPP1_000979 [Malassezia sp. CBS 17886]
MSDAAAELAANAPKPPPRSRARASARKAGEDKTADAGGENAEAVDTPADAPKPEADDTLNAGGGSAPASGEVSAADEYESRLAAQQQQLETVTLSRDELVERSTGWLEELETLRAEHAAATESLDALRTEHASATASLESLRSEHASLAQSLEEQRARADEAEERVRDLRFTAEESRRAIMRLQQSDARAKPKQLESPRSDADQAELRKSRRASLVVGRVPSGGSADADAESERSGLRGLKLSGVNMSSPPSVSPDFPPPLPPRDEADESLESAEKEAEPSNSPHAPSGAAPRGISSSLLSSASRLRPTFSLLRKQTPGAAVGGATDGGEAAPNAERSDTPDAARVAELERSAAEVSVLREQMQALQTQLTESREAQQASEQCIRSLREYIVGQETGGGGAGAEKAAPTLDTPPGRAVNASLEKEVGGAGGDDHADVSPDTGPPPALPSKEDAYAVDDEEEQFDDPQP